MSYKPPKPQNIGKVGYDGNGHPLGQEGNSAFFKRAVAKQRKRIEWSRKYGFGG